MTELSLHILDIVQNSIRANATNIQVIIEENSNKNLYIIEITDNGDGMTSEILNQVTNPFFTTRTTRNVGLGLSLFKQSAEQCGGSMEIISEPQIGTTVKTIFELNNIDRPKLGDIAGTMTLLIGANPQIHFLYIHRTNLSDFEFDTKEVNEELDGTPINHPDILKTLKTLIEENLELIESSL